MKKFALLIILLASSCSTVPESASGVKDLQCVPYARDKSGIEIYGDAHTWWHKAPKQNYPRGFRPKSGSVMVLAKTNRLKWGHVAYVKKVVSSRKIIVSHANWGTDIFGRGIIYENMEAIDVSKKNDWSQIRFWSEEGKSFGYMYPANGFIYNKKKRS